MCCFAISRDRFTVEAESFLSNKNRGKLYIEQHHCHKHHADADDCGNRNGLMQNKNAHKSGHHGFQRS